MKCLHSAVSVRLCARLCAESKHTASTLPSRQQCKSLIDSTKKAHVLHATQR